jgi:hypothetical protein
VLLNGVAATLASHNNSAIVVRAGHSAVLGTGLVTVLADTGTVSVLANAFTYDAASQIALGHALGQRRPDRHARDHQRPGGRVCRRPWHGRGTGAVVSLTNGWTYQNASFISSVSPNGGQFNTTVTITRDRRCSATAVASQAHCSTRGLWRHGTGLSNVEIHAASSAVARLHAAAGRRRHPVTGDGPGRHARERNHSRLQGNSLAWVRLGGLDPVAEQLCGG